MRTHDLEHDIPKHAPLMARLRADKEFARQFYATLCNHRFRHTTWRDESDYWSCSWRYAAGFIAKLRGNTEDYLDFYCSGEEGYVIPDVLDALKDIGWSIVDMENTHD